MVIVQTHDGMNTAENPHLTEQRILPGSQTSLGTALGEPWEARRVVTRLRSDELLVYFLL